MGFLGATVRRNRVESTRALLIRGRLRLNLLLFGGLKMLLPQAAVKTHANTSQLGQSPNDSAPLGSVKWTNRVASESSLVSTLGPGHGAHDCPGPGPRRGDLSLRSSVQERSLHSRRRSAFLAAGDRGQSPSRLKPGARIGLLVFDPLVGGSSPRKTRRTTRSAACPSSRTQKRARSAASLARASSSA